MKLLLRSTKANKVNTKGLFPIKLPIQSKSDILPNNSIVLLIIHRIHYNSINIYELEYLWIDN